MRKAAHHAGATRREHSGITTIGTSMRSGPSSRRWTGKIDDAFYQCIAKPIGMQDFEPGDVYYLKGSVSVHPAFRQGLSTVWIAVSAGGMKNRGRAQSIRKLQTQKSPIALGGPICLASLVAQGH
jgi:hypothetical protein